MTLYSIIIINPPCMCRRVMVVILCVCLSVTELTATYFVCKSKVHVWRYKVPYTWHSKRTVWFMWILSKSLYLPVLASFADSMLLDFSRASDSMTLHINRMLCVPCYLQYGRIINPWRMHYMHGSPCWSLNPWSTGKVEFDDHGMTVASFQL